MTAVAISIVIAFAALADLPLQTPQLVIAIVVRAVFFYVPLLVGPTYLEKYVLRRITK